MEHGFKLFPVHYTFSAVAFQTGPGLLRVVKNGLRLI
jgi:hypothetical protein